MKRLKLFFLSIFFLLTSTVALADSDGTHAEKASVAAATQQWTTAIDARDAKAISALYDPEALLYATFANKLDTHQEIYNYFVNLTKKKNLHVKFTDQNIRVFNEQIAVNSGKYTFSYTDDAGKTVNVPARYTFVYAKTPTGWIILDHHSSLLPESTTQK